MAHFARVRLAKRNAFHVCLCGSQVLAHAQIVFNLCGSSEQNILHGKSANVPIHTNGRHKNRAENETKIYSSKGIGSDLRSGTSSCHPLSEKYAKFQMGISLSKSVALKIDFEKKKTYVLISDDVK